MSLCQIYRCCFTLRFVPVGNVLVVSHFRTFLGTAVSISCEIFSKNTSYKIRSHSWCSDWSTRSVGSRGCHHDPIFSREVFIGSSARWSRIWDHSYSTNLVFWKRHKYNILFTYSSTFFTNDGRNNFCCHYILDHTQGTNACSSKQYYIPVIHP